MKKILLLGTHGQYNWGDDLLLETFLKQLGSDNEYYINSYDPLKTSEFIGSNFKVKVFHTTRDINKLLSYLFKVDVVFFAGGTILRELYSTNKRNRYSSLLMVTSLIFFAKKIARKKVILSNIGVGPLNTKTGRSLTKIAINNTDYVSLRDQSSFDLLKSLNIHHKNIRVVPDVIFIRTKADFLSDQQKNKDANKNSLSIALNLNFNIANSGNWDYFINQLQKAILVLREKYDLTIKTIPMQIAFNPENDVKTLKEFIQLLPGVKVIEFIPKSPMDIGTKIAECDIALGERFHFIVISSIINIPVVALEYDIKVTSLVKQLGIENYGIDINSQFHYQSIVEAIELALQKREEIQEVESKKVQEFNSILKDYFIDLKKFL